MVQFAFVAVLLKCKAHGLQSVGYHAVRTFPRSRADKLKSITESTFLEKRSAQVTFSAGWKDHDDHLPGILRPRRHLVRHTQGRPR